MAPAPPPSRSAGKSAALAVGLGVGFAAMTGVVVGALYSANALSTTAASRQASKPALQEGDLQRDGAGRILNWKTALRIIQQGGIEPALRARLWPVLLGVFDPACTTAEREAETARLAGVYRRLLGICSELEAEAAAGKRRGGAAGAAAAFADAHRIIVMDALRTDLRDEPAQEDGEGLSVVAVRLEGSDSEIMLVQRDDEQAGEQETGLGSPEHQLLAKDTRIAPAVSCENGTTIAALPGSSGNSLETGNQTRDAVVAQISSDEDCATVSSGTSVEGPNNAEAAAWTSAAARDAAPGVPGGPAAATRMHSLVRLLSAYAVHDPDIGYCQGMSDLAAAALGVVPGEALAFACFERIMRAARRNFRHDEVGIRHQLRQLSLILADTDPRLYARLHELDSGDCMFAYRMVVVLLRRELTLAQALLVWEAAWAHAAAAGTPDGVPLAGGSLRCRASPPEPQTLQQSVPAESSSAVPDRDSDIDVPADGEASADSTANRAQISTSSSAGPGITGSSSSLTSLAQPPAPPDFVLQFIAAVVRGQRRGILGTCCDADDVLRLFSGVRIDFWLTMALAQKQHKAYRSGPTSLMPATL